MVKYRHNGTDYTLYDLRLWTDEQIFKHCTVVCGCGRGHGSHIDGLCKFCRETKYSRAQAKSVNVRHRGDGMSLEQEGVLLGTIKRSEVYI